MTINPEAYYPRDGESVVWVGRWKAHCSACGGNADPDAGCHDRSGDALDREGCGAPWVRRVNVYFTPSESALNMTDMARPMYPERG